MTDPIDMLLWCPQCNAQHIDAPSEGWDNPSHRSHLCHECGCIWRPADVPTNGVGEVKTAGEADTWGWTGGHSLLPPLGRRLSDALASLEIAERDRREANKGLADIVAKLAKADCECDSFHGFTNCLSCQARATLEWSGEAGEVEPAAWTGSGSMAALKDGREGFIWPAKADAHPIPLYARPPGEVIALHLDRKVGMYGSAYDPPGPCRAYTYEHQPSNLPAYSLGRAHAAAAAMSAGDNIDRGLSLLKALEDQGFGVFEIDPVTKDAADD